MYLYMHDQKLLLLYIELNQNPQTCRNEDYWNGCFVLYRHKDSKMSVLNYIVLRNKESTKKVRPSIDVKTQTHCA